MKKVLYTFAIIAVTLMACESNSDDQPNPGTMEDSTILPTKLVIVESDGETETINYTYQGERLIKAEYTYSDFDNITSNYVYVDDKLTNINDVFLNDDDILESYTYDSEGRISTITTNIIGDGVYEYNVAYNSDNSLVTVSSITNPSPDSSTSTIANGNITQGTELNYYTTTYTYDNKNAPFKNLEHREVLLRLFSENNEGTFYTLNNITNETVIDNSTMDSEITTYSYTYTASNYPRTVIENYDGDITTYTYTYNND
ncbi:hypothetical protein [Lacinutrix salivirga]